MEQVDTPELSSFRREVRSWLDANTPVGWSEADEGDENAQKSLLHSSRAKLRAAGYLAPHWPKEFGGGGFSSAQQIVLKQELLRAKYPPVGGGIAFHHAAATIIMHGTPEQQRHLAAILDGEIWCQGFSEPNAGSDLASLQTCALRDGDTYVVNGQKIWSSGAHNASWCLLLARTDVNVPKHQGISMFMLDMSSPGVEVRPIRQSTGSSEFSEVFLTDVRMPLGHRIGPENEGWRLAQTTLSTERGSFVIEFHAQLLEGLEKLCLEAAGVLLEPGRFASQHDGIRQDLADCAAEVEVLGMLAEKVIGRLVRHGEMGPEGSILKLFWSETHQRLTGLAARIRGIAADVDSGAPRSGWTSGDWLIDHIGSWALTISAGSNEIQRNIIAERVLGLPREPALN